MLTINDSARSAQCRRPLFSMIQGMRAVAGRVVLLVAVAGAAYLPGVVTIPAPQAHAPVAASAQVAARPFVQCPGVALPC